MGKRQVENYNGLVRQYFPKGHDFTTITPERLLEVEKEINDRPRNILAYKAETSDSETQIGKARQLL